MATLLLDIQPGDEAIMPSYTFVSTANAFVLRGGVAARTRCIAIQTTETELNRHSSTTHYKGLDSLQALILA